MSNLNFDKLFASYKLFLKEDEQNNLRSNHWKDHKTSSEKFFKEENLHNFRKNRLLSYGMDDSIMGYNPIKLFEAANEFDSDFLKFNLPKKNIGNCNYGIKLLDRYFDYNIMYHLKWFQKIQKYIKNNFLVLEIGAGYGSLTRLILKNFNVKVFIIDLPEAALLSNYFLQSNFPEKKFFNLKDFEDNNHKIDNNIIEKNDIFILPPKVLNNIELKFNFIINARSFSEMNKEMLNYYFNFINNNTVADGFFLNINKYLKKSGDLIKFHEFQYDRNWHVEISERSYKQNDINFLLTKRTLKTGNIFEELKSIKIVSNRYEKNYNLRFGFFNLKSYTYKFLITIMKIFFSNDNLKKIGKIIYGASINNKEK